MIKLIDLLNEAPIGTYKTIGDFEKGASYKDTRDRAAVSHSATVQKVKDMLKNTSVDFDFYFVNKSGLGQFRERGKVPYEFIFKPYPEGLGLTHEEMGDKTINSDNITVFFVSNVAADAFQEYTTQIDKQFDELLAMYGKQKTSRFPYNDATYKKSRTFELAKGRLFNHIGTMRSAREGRIHRRYFEFYFELFVQYLKDGKITFNPLTKDILVGFGPYGSKTLARTQNLEESQEKLDMIANTIPYYIEDVLTANMGDIFVM